MTLLKINRLLPIHTSNVLLKFELDIKNQTKLKLQKHKNPIWLPGSHVAIDLAENPRTSAYSHKQHAHEIWNLNSKANSSYIPETMMSMESNRPKIQYGHPAAILKMTLLKIDRLLPINASTSVLCNWSLKLIFKANLKLESRNQKIQYGHQAAILKVTSLKSKIGFCLCRLKTDGQMDRRTRWFHYSPSNFVGREYKDSKTFIWQRKYMLLDNIPSTFHLMRSKTNFIQQTLRQALWILNINWSVTHGRAVDATFY